MEKEQVIAVLEFYRDADRQIRENQWEIRELEARYYDSAGSSPAGERISGKGRISNTVERMAMKSIGENVSGEIRYLEQQNETIRRVKLEIRKELDTLTSLQRRILLKFYIEGIYWSKIAMQVHFCVRQCKRIRDSSLRKLSVRFFSNPIISDYFFQKN